MVAEPRGILIGLEPTSNTANIPTGWTASTRS